MSTPHRVPNPSSSLIPLLLFLMALVSQVPALAQAGVVRLDWPSPEPAEQLTRPIVLRVEDARPRATRERVGKGHKPTESGATSRGSAENWVLVSSASFESSLHRSVQQALRARGIWAGRTEMLDSPASLTIQVRRFWCNEPGTPAQACSGEARLQMGMSLLPTVSVEVGADEPEPFDALAGALSSALADTIASVSWGLPAGVGTHPRAFAHSPEHGWGQVTGGSEQAVCLWVDGRVHPVPRDVLDRRVRLAMPERGSVGWVLGESPDHAPKAVLAPFAGDLFALEIATFSLHRLGDEARWVAYAPSSAHRPSCSEPAQPAAKKLAVEEPPATQTPSEPWTPAPPPPSASPSSALAELAHLDADGAWDFKAGGRKASFLGRGAQSARVEVRHRTRDRVVRVLVQLDGRVGEVEMVARYNPPGAGWLSEPMQHRGDGVYEAQFPVEMRGGTYVYCAVLLAGRVPAPVFASRSELFQVPVHDR